LVKRLGPILVALMLMVQRPNTAPATHFSCPLQGITVIVELDPWPLYFCPAVLAFGTAVLVFDSVFKACAAVVVGLLVKESQLKGFSHAINALGATGAYCLADWHPAYEMQLMVPLVVGALLHCRVRYSAPALVSVACAARFTRDALTTIPQRGLPRLLHPRLCRGTRPPAACFVPGQRLIRGTADRCSGGCCSF